MPSQVPTAGGRGKAADRGPSGKKAAQDRSRARSLLAAQKRRDARNRMLIRVGAPVLAVILVIAVLLAVKLNQKPAVSTAAPTGAAPSAVTAALAAVPAATFATVGVGTVAAAPTAISGTPLTANGKPRVLYIGAEYCPYCAAERWAMVVALSRFGTFSGLGQTTSSSTDVYPSTPTLSFHGATFTSDVLSFTGVETTTNVATANGYAPLDTPTAADQALMTQYNSSGSIPFVDLGNRYLISGASYDPGVLKGLTHQQIATEVADPSTAVAKAVDGSANVITAAVCALTGQKPAAVCTSAGVVAGAAKLPK